VPPQTTFVQLLKAAAYRKHGHAGRDRGAHQRQRRRIAGRVVLRARCARFAAVSMRLDVRIAAGKQQAVDGVEHVVDRLAFAERGQQHRERLRAVDNGGDVLVADRMRRVCADLRVVGGDADERFPFHDVDQWSIGSLRAHRRIGQNAGVQRPRSLAKRARPPLRARSGTTARSALRMTVRPSFVSLRHAPRQ